MLMTKIERPTLGLLSLVGKLGALAVRPAGTTAARSDTSGTNAHQAFAFIVRKIALRVTSINQHAVKHASKQVGRLNASNWKRSIWRPQKPRVANG
jgi:hypothetical protein